MGTTFSHVAQTPISVGHLPMSCVVGCVGGLAWVAYQASILPTTATTGAAPAGAGKANTGSGGVGLSAVHYAPAVLVTAAWGLLYYAFLWDQSATAFVVTKDLRRKARAAGKPPPSMIDVKYGAVRSDRVRIADRVVINYLEQSPAFLTALWTHACFVSPTSAAAAGWVWIASRAIYPWVYPLPFPGLFASTMPAYACVFYLGAGVVRAALAA
mmetsp:Transcript_10598/g.25970  ORF Transcript_10598/g.25970 Transcript_10598/m.25970 type:complete len:213 (-) Transcript_10598:404-1042(-)|eukprot:CAMPEP_0197589512 /NCGR_PEP_ID=MMETSP1326-20131121/10433_1 /TAXON_ID=1155430 /ORGANISM="Genus nov. species nov., Strain RCC2288" /LENGTH=212 /DNA_ID=CAMNT_0043154453 /DNA_START=172 /DNA_END=810 /DNA_ORIENTATION=-